MANTPTYKELEQRIKELEKKVAKRKQVEEAFQRITDEQAVLLSTVPAMIFWIDKEGAFIRVNDAFAAALHKSPDDIKGKSLFDLYPEDMARGYYNDNVKVIESGTPKKHIEEPVETTTGTIWVRTDKIPYRDEKGEVVGIIGFSEDITERKKAEEALQESEEKYRTLFEDSRDAAYIATREGKLVEVNQSFLDLFCITREEIPDLNVRQLYVNPDERPRFQKKIEKKGSVKDFEVKLRKKDRTEMDCLLTSTVWRAYDGSILGYQGIVRDITEHKRDVQALREREKELKIKTMSLEEVNIALRVLLKKRDEDKIELEEKVLSNVKELVVPFLAKVKKTPLDPKQVAYIDILESNLNDIISPFIRNLSAKYVNLTPTQIQVANLIKEGKTTKEIGAMMTVSPRTIETHRKNMRKKLGIEKKKGNLRSHLLTFQ